MMTDKIDIERQWLQKVYPCPSAHVTASVEKISYQTSKGTVSSIQWNPS